MSAEWSDENKYYCCVCQDYHGIAYYCVRLYGDPSLPSGPQKEESKP